MQPSPPKTERPPSSQLRKVVFGRSRKKTMSDFGKYSLVIVVAGLFAAEGSKAGDGKSLITSWNVCSKQFIDAPVFKLLPIPEANCYRAEVAQGETKWAVTSKQPILDLGGIWKKVDVKKFQLKLQWLKQKGGQVVHEEISVRVKAPDFAGLQEPAANWAAAADKNIAYLINAADHAESPYREPNVPVWIWAATPGYHLGYPCITINPLTWAFLAHIENKGTYSEDALRLARAGADWGLKNRKPNSGALPLFPYSTITMGKFGGALEGNAVNLLRASWLATSYVDLYEVTRYQPYLDYAGHIADTTVKFQNPDGGFPYRVDANTGAAVELYNPNAMEFVDLVAKLEPHGFNATRAMAAQRAVDWMLNCVCGTMNWKASFEDVGPSQFYSNLSQMGAQPLIRYLCRHKDQDPSYLPTARKLNRWVEDQFVTFGIENAASPVRDKGPLVFEQFDCWWPMEGHTANWILTLIELNKATGDKQYLDKAKAAANAICRDQYPDGQFSTWGRDFETGKTVVETMATDNPSGYHNWYNANAQAARALYKLTLYINARSK